MSTGEHERARCGANLAKHGRPCRAFPLKGAKRCKLHGGLQQTLPKGDPRRGGRPPVHGLYARSLTDESMREAYRDAATLTGTLDEELKLKRAYLANAIARQQEDPDGGVRVEYGKQTKLRLWREIVLELTEQIRKLELARFAMEQGGNQHTVNAVDRILAEIERRADEATTGGHEA